MKKVKLLKYQSLFDIAIQETGEVENVFDIAFSNNMSITDEFCVVQGTVNSAVSNGPIEEALVFIKDTIRGVKTNIKGEFTIIVPLSVTLCVAYPDHKVLEFNVGELDDITLEEGVSELDIQRNPYYKIKDILIVLNNELVIPDNIEYQNKTHYYYSSNQLKPATGVSASYTPGEEKEEGIEFWYVEYDFVVS